MVLWEEEEEEEEGVHGERQKERNFHLWALNQPLPLCGSIGGLKE